MKKHFINLFTYNDWANNQIINAFEKCNEVPDKALKIFSHIITAQDVWLERIVEPEKYTISFWEVYTLKECILLSQKSTKNWLKFLNKLNEDGVWKTHTYKNSKGTEFKNSIYDSLTHLTMHSAYHRGQINTILRENNYEPAVTDYIYYLRR